MTAKVPLYQEMARLLVAIDNCRKSGNAEWMARHSDTLRRHVREYMPSGSGFDSGTELDFDRSNSAKLVFRTSFHHMNRDGFYDGWTDHTVTVRACLAFGYDVRVGGSNRNDIREYIGDCFAESLSYREYE